MDLSVYKKLPLNVRINLKMLAYYTAFAPAFVGISRLKWENMSLYARVVSSFRFYQPSAFNKKSFEYYLDANLRSYYKSVGHYNNYKPN